MGTLDTRVHTITAEAGVGGAVMDGVITIATIITIIRTTTTIITIIIMDIMADIINNNAEWIALFKRTIRSQNSGRIETIIGEPNFTRLSGSILDAILKDYALFIQEKKFILPFVFHPQFKKISSKTLAQIFLISIRLGQEQAIEWIIGHPQIKRMPPDEVDKLIDAILEYTNGDLLKQLEEIPCFQTRLESHLAGMYLCAIRTGNSEWLEDLFKNYSYTQVEKAYFPELIRGALKQRSRKLVHLVLSHHHFQEKSEKTFVQEFFNAFLGEVEEKRKIAENYLIKELLSHQDFEEFSPVLLGWLIDKSILHHDIKLFANLKKHKNFPSLNGEILAALLISSLSYPKFLKEIIHHPKINELSGNQIGLVLEEAINKNKKGIINLILAHTHFSDIPEDSFRRSALADLTSSKFLKKNIYLEEVKKKYRVLIMELIRRKESAIISQLVHDPDIKSVVIEALFDYTTMDPIYVNEYNIRDVLSEIFMTSDKDLISKIVSNPIFSAKIPGVVKQAIDSNDEELIEKMLLEPLLRDYCKKKQ